MAALFGFVCVRYTRIFFGILTLALSQVLWSLAFKFFWVTGGTDGLRVPTPSLLGAQSAPGEDKIDLSRPPLLLLRARDLRSSAPRSCG